MNFSVLCKTLKSAKMRNAESNGVFQFIFENVILRRIGVESWPETLVCQSFYPSHDIYLHLWEIIVKSQFIELKRKGKRVLLKLTQ